MHIVYMKERLNRTNKVQNDIDLLASEAAQNFIFDHQNDDIYSLILKDQSVKGIPTLLIAEQIRGRQKAQLKAPAMAGIPGVVFPSGLNLEQSSSEITAKFKANFVQSRIADNKTLVDLTGGFGIDSWAFAKVFNKVISVDPDLDLNCVVRHNLTRGHVTNIERLDMDAARFLDSNAQAVSCFFADPSRRVNSRKVAALADCEPNVVALTEAIFRQSDYLLIKTSPLLDISMGLSQLDFVSEVIVLAVDNECRELLFFCKRGEKKAPRINAVNITKGVAEELAFTLEDERNATPIYGELHTYIYEPNAAVLKAGAFKLVACRLNLTKLAKHTHFYTGIDLVPSFPGRIFRVEHELKCDARAAAKLLPEGKANVISRNYPLDVAGLRKKLSIKDGGDRYIIATATEKRKVLAVCSRLK
jgi:THUMP domain-like